MARFKVGQVVEALADAQGMRKGWWYTVVDAEHLSMPWGTFVAYSLAPEGGEPEDVIEVVNGHMLLTLANPDPNA